LPADAWASTLVAVTPIWGAEGLAEPAVDDLVGAVYLHPFPPSFGDAPDVPSVGRMRAEGFDSGAFEAASWIDGIGGGRPIVYLTSGTEPAAATAPWKAALEAIGDRDVQAIVTIGNRLDPAVLGAVPANVRVERFVPQRLILARASVAMSHAGAGSLLGAAAFGLPQLLNPLRADQWENADAATAAGAAITCEMDQRTAADIGAALDRLLYEPVFREAAARVAAEIAAMPSPADHVATVEALALA
jgi:UDP:flavonoid glycosyltransferase YjiC (YdhE family)